MFEKTGPIYAAEGDSFGHAHIGLPPDALMVLAQEVITHLSRRSEQTIRDGLKPDRVKVVPNIDGFCAALLGRDPDAARRMILAAHAEGASHEDLALLHIAAAARRLGVQWEDDEITFSEMAVATGRILHLLRDLRELAPPFEPRGDRCALIATVPGETHLIGATMATDLFRDRGWDIDLRVGLNETALMSSLRAGGYPIVGLSTATLDRLRELTRVVLELRLVAPKVLIFIGGNIARLDPDIAMRVGADGAAWDMEDCVSEMERLYALVPRPSRP